CRRANLILACSEVDAAALQQLAPGARMAVVPNGVDLDANRPATPTPTPTPTAEDNSRPQQLVFVGQMGWFPNRDGVEWFLDDVFHRILEARPKTQFVLVGKIEGLAVPAAVAAQVILAGFVPDLKPYVASASVYIVPLRAGSGTRLKVLEAMALGKAIVTTSIGSEGIALRHGHSALYADDAAAFAAATITLLDSPAQAKRLGAAARACAEAHYGWDAVGQKLLACYQLALGAEPLEASARRAVSPAA
ncbi:MAG: glycosyltransferase family 4 protein, partial [Pseudoxanthomonas sp.]